MISRAFKIKKEKEKKYLKVVIGLLICAMLFTITYHLSKAITYRIEMNNYTNSIDSGE